MNAQLPQTALAVNTRSISGWPAELLTGISAAPCRRVAAGLVACSRDAINALPDSEREALLEAIQDTVGELPDDDLRVLSGAQDRAGVIAAAIIQLIFRCPTPNSLQARIEALLRQETRRHARPFDP